MMLGWLNKKVEIAEKCSMNMKNKNAYKQLVEMMCKRKPHKKPRDNWKII